MANWKALARRARSARPSPPASPGTLAVDLPPAPTLPAVSTAARSRSAAGTCAATRRGLQSAPDLACEPDDPRRRSGVLSRPMRCPRSAYATLSASGTIDAGLGYVFNALAPDGRDPRIPLGGRLSVDTSDADPAPFGRAGPYAAERLRAGFPRSSALVNGYVDLGNYWGVTPFVGAGVGVADNALSGRLRLGASLSGRRAAAGRRIVLQRFEDQFRLGADGGLDFDIAPNLRLELGYRYLDLGSFAIGGLHCSPAPRAAAAAAGSPSRRAGAGLQRRPDRTVWLVGEPVLAPRRQNRAAGY